MPRYKLTIEYDGTKFVGWQHQPDQMSIQQSIIVAFNKFIGKEVDVYGAGRTDAGVHALGQVAHVDIPEQSEEYVIRNALNNYLYPLPIVILKVEKVSPEFHARYSAKLRSYLYRIINRRSRLTLENNRAWCVYRPLDVALIRKGASYLLGIHDFSTFRATECSARSPIKTLDSIRIERRGDLIMIHVYARSFLHHQVRNIVGTLSLVGDKKWQPEDVKHALEACDRRKGGPTAPPNGLYLRSVDY
jgi:tRNA pseudouridine38-40 synthase